MDLSSRSTFRLLCALVFVLGASMSSSAVARSPGKALERAAVRFQQALEALDSGPRESEHLVGLVAARAGELLTQYRVRWTFAAGDLGVIVITPVKSGSTLNELAAGLKRNLGGLELRFDPRALRLDNAGALYDENAHHLLMSAQEVASGSVSDYLAHEIIHAQNFHALSQGVDNFFMGWISSRQSAAPFHETYPHLFSIDELQAYAQQARVNIRELDRGDGHGDVEGTIEMLDSGWRLALAVTARTADAGRLIAAIVATGPQRHGFSETLVMDEVPVRVTGFEGANGRVYFYRWQMPSRIPSPPTIMRAVAETGDFGVDLIITQAFSPDSADEALMPFRERMRWLADRSAAMAVNFKELKSLVTQGDYARAVERSRALRALGGRN